MEMLDHLRCWTLIILMSVNGFLSYELLHTRQMTSMNEEDPMMENDDIARVEENLGSNFFEGDIITTPEQMKRIDQLLFHHTVKDVDMPRVRGLVKDLRRTWTNGMVYYMLSDGLGADRTKMINDAIEHWKQRTCLQFNERKNEPDYIKFQTGKGCSSYVGRIGGGQRLVVGEKCKFGNVIHEIGHAIGFFHEMARPDRDEFVKINWGNIISGYQRNFLKFSKNIIDSRNSPYDYGSIMHYSRTHFTKSGLETIVPTKDPTAQIGQRLRLSTLDAQQAKLLYNCGTRFQGNGQTRTPRCQVTK